MAILALEPSASVTPPCWLTTSAAASSAASLLIPNERTTPDLAPKPAILTVLSCAPTPTTNSGAESATSSPKAEASLFMGRPPVVRAGKVGEESGRSLLLCRRGCQWRGLWHRPLRRSASESGRSRHGAGGPPGRQPPRAHVLMLTILILSRATWQFAWEILVRVGQPGPPMGIFRGG